MDVIKRTDGLSRQAELMLQQAYRRGYKDGEGDSEKRHEAKWLMDGELIYQVMVCSQCGAKWIKDTADKPQKYCHGCGAKMEE